MVVRRWWFAAFAVLVVTAGCADETTVRTEAASGSGGWTAQELGPPGDDSMLRLAASDDATVVVIAGPDGELQPWRDDGSGTFVPAAVDGEARGLRVVELDVGPDGFVVTGTTTSQEPFAYAAPPDGSVWSPVEAPSTGDAAAPAEGLPDGPMWHSHATVGDGVLVVGGSSLGPGDPMHVPAVARSTDGGETWSTVELPPTFPDNDVWLVGGGALIGAFAWPAALAAPDADACYRDIASCRRREPATLHVSDDGATWQQVDTRPLGDDPRLRVDDLELLPDGRLLVLGAVAEATVWTWDGVELPPAPVTTTTTPPADELPPLVEWGDDLEVGVVGRRPLGTHCGIGDLGPLDGDPWVIVEGPIGGDANSGGGVEPPPHWPYAQGVLYGYVVLGDDDRLRYSIDAAGRDVIAVYERSPGSGASCA